MSKTTVDNSGLTIVTPPVVGSMRNLVGAGSGAATATWTADQLVAWSALNGGSVIGSSLSLTNTLTNVGANGRDVASVVHGQFWVYAIYGASVGWATLATISTLGASIYSGTLPTGYTYSALIYSGHTGATDGTYVAFNQRDRRVWIPSAAVTGFSQFSNGVGAGWGGYNISNIVPWNTVTVSGFAGTIANKSMAVAGGSGGLVPYNTSVGAATGVATNGLYGSVNFEDLPLLSPVLIYVSTADTTASAYTLSITGYTF